MIVEGQHGTKMSLLSGLKKEHNKTPYVLLTMTVLLSISFVGMASAQNMMGFFINSYDNLCTEAFLRSVDGSHTVVRRNLDSISEHKSILIHLPTDKSEGLLHALLERPDVFSVQTFPVVGEPPFPDDQYYSPTAHEPAESRPECYPELDPILNNIVRNMLGSPDHDLIPAPYDHAHPEDLIGVVVNTYEPLRVQEYLEQNGAVMLSTIVLDGHSSMEAFVPVSLLIPFVEQHPDVEVSAMIMDERIIIHTGDWYYNPGGVSHGRHIDDRIYWYASGGHVGVINMSADRALASDELPADIQYRCYYSDKLESSDKQRCEEDIDARIVEILMDAPPQVRLYVVETDSPHIISTANWMLDRAVDTIHIITDAGTLTVTMSRAYLLPPAMQPSPFNNEPSLDIDDAVLSKGNPVSHTFFVWDYDISDDLYFAAESSNRSIATIDVRNAHVADQPPGYSNTYRSGYMNIIPHSTGMAKVTVSVTDGASVVTGIFVVNVNNTAPRLHVVSKMPHLVVGEENYFIPAVDPDGDTLSFEIFEPAGGLESVSVSIFNNTLALTPIAQGQDDIGIKVSDGRGGHDSVEVRVCVVTSNIPPQISPMPSYLAVPVDSEPIAVPVLATDADGDIIFLISIAGHNYTVADVHYPSLDFGPAQEVIYPWPPPCEGRGGGDYSMPLFIIPNTAGNTTVTIRAWDAWGGKDTETFQVIVYEPVDPYHVDGWWYEIPRGLFPYHSWAP